MIAENALVVNDFAEWEKLRVYKPDKQCFFPSELTWEEGCALYINFKSASASSRKDDT